MHQTGCRFDDLRARVAWVMEGPLGQCAAERLEDVLPVLRQVDEAVAAGHHAAGFVSYEAAPAFDPALVVRSAPAPGPLPGPGPVPLAWFGIFAGRRRVPVVTPPSHPVVPGTADGDWDWELDEAAHGRAVAAVRQRIAAGDVYQVNLTGRLRRRWPVDDPPAVDRCYRELAAAQRGSFHALLRTPSVSVVSASPEQFFSLQDGVVTCRPMKGTAGRGWPAGGPDDCGRALALARSSKERAENVMVVDLLRNDVGRVAEPGTVQVPALFTLEAFPTVWQLTSTVTGQVPAGTGVERLFGALFPCGSVTGAPKVAAMAAIADLERSRRGVYCGAIGWVGPGRRGPRARFAVAIRTLVVDHRSDVAEYGVGGAVTWPSVDSAEWAELQAKAAVLGAVRWPSTVGATG